MTVGSPREITGFYTWYVGTLRDGRITTQLPMIQTAWSDVMDDAGTLQGVLPLADADVASINPYLVAEPCRCFLAVAYLDDTGTETFLAGGPIWTHNYDGKTKQLIIAAAGLWSYYDHRKILPVLSLGADPATVTTELTNSLPTIAKGLVQLAHLHTTGAVPVVFPADIAGTKVRKYPGFAMANVGDALRDLTSVQNGPEIAFRPRRRADDGRFIEWVMNTGTDVDPLLHQVGDDWVWDDSVPSSSVSSVSVNRDGTAMGTRAWVQGAGTDSTTLFSEYDSTALTAAGFPLLEVLEGHSNVKDQDTLDSYAQGLAQRSSRPRETWTVVVRRDEIPTVAAYSVGDYVTLTVGKDPYLPNGDYRSRIVARSGDDSADVTLALAPTLAPI